MADETDKANEGASMVRHDIRNQLSNITLAVEQLKYELPDLNEDAAFYIDTIATGCKKINELLKKMD